MTLPQQLRRLATYLEAHNGKCPASELLLLDGPTITSTCTRRKGHKGEHKAQDGHRFGSTETLQAWLDGRY
ncbi:hypothetical protein GCM10022287_22090 [Gryllotalpicola koreensis]|uniref:Uncharacterized protein n=1 Tax=Gryllotalpicola koreensis TaxID=993086 RepID=A0ABP8A1U8_9MICO